MTAIGDMVSEEIATGSTTFPQAILRLAARRLDHEQNSSSVGRFNCPTSPTFSGAMSPGQSPASSTEPVSR